MVAGGSEGMGGSSLTGVSGGAVGMGAAPAGTVSAGTRSTMGRAGTAVGVSIARVRSGPVAA
ncbi:MAG: hypothetical protein WKF80_07710 [Thermomicrobiales bacterium]